MDNSQYWFSYIRNIFAWDLKGRCIAVRICIVLNYPIWSPMDSKSILWILEAGIPRTLPAIQVHSTRPANTKPRHIFENMFPKDAILAYMRVCVWVFVNVIRHIFRHASTRNQTYSSTHLSHTNPPTTAAPHPTLHIHLLAIPRDDQRQRE